MSEPDVPPAHPEGGEDARLAVIRARHEADARAVAMITAPIRGPYRQANEDRGYLLDRLAARPESAADALVEAIQKIAETMGLATIAEYVESEEIASKLVAIGVPWGQGYHLGVPGPLETAIPGPGGPPAP